MRTLVMIFFWASLGLTLASFGGALHGLGDSLAVFRFWWALGLSICSVLLLNGHWRIAGIGAMAVVLAAAPMVIGTLRPNQPGTGGYVFYQKNLLYNGSDRAGILADILDVSPDFLSLQEVGHRNQFVYESLAAQYPSRLICSSHGVAVLSKYPLVPGSKHCVGDQGLAVMQVVTPAGPVWVAALHLHWPYPQSQSRQVDFLVSEMGFLDGPVVLGGDFNMVPWSHTMRLFENATNSKRAGPVLRTFQHDKSPLRLPIDHILVPDGLGQLETRPLLGSDHLGLLLRFNL